MVGPWFVDIQLNVCVCLTHAYNYVTVIALKQCFADFGGSMKLVPLSNSRLTAGVVHHTNTFITAQCFLISISVVYLLKVTYYFLSSAFCVKLFVLYLCEVCHLGDILLMHWCFYFKTDISSYLKAVET